MSGPAPAKTPVLGWMDSLAEPTRLRLLRLLERQELGVTELTDVLQMPQSTVSRHLKLLANQGFIHGRSEGTANLYAMRPTELPPPARRLWALVREQTEGWATARQDQLRLDRCLHERRRESQAFFARSAESWDRLREELYGGAFTAVALRALLPRDWVVADLACGTGSVAGQLAEQVQHVIGVDQSQAMLRAARRRLGDCDNVELRRGDLEALPVDDGCCDAALLILALSYVADPGAALREAARILRPGGRAVIVDLLRHDRDDFRRQMGQQRLGFEPEELCALLQAAALNHGRCAPLPPEPRAKGPALLLASAERAPLADAGRSDDRKKTRSVPGGPGRKER